MIGRETVDLIDLGREVSEGHPSLRLISRSALPT